MINAANIIRPTVERAVAIAPGKPGWIERLDRASTLIISASPPEAHPHATMTENVIM